ncbi:MAG: NAD-dependent epimerase/dehydratase family protein [Gammaproteobacteria bacterium]
MNGRPAGALIIGAGYLAGFLVDGLLPATPVIAVRRSQGPQAPRSGLTSVACDVTSATGARILAPVLRDFQGTVFCLLPPSVLGPRDPHTCFARLFELLRASACRGAVLASSTGIYDKDMDVEITAATPIDPGTARARRLQAIEQCWQDSGLPCQVLRLAGLYGPGRIIGRSTILAGEALAGDAQAWLNLLRAEDAAAALLAAARATTPGVAVVSDGRPLRREEYYGVLAQLLGRAPPAFDGQAGRRGGSRRIDPAASWARLGIAPRYTDVRRSLAALVAEETSTE